MMCKVLFLLFHPLPYSLSEKMSGFHNSAGSFGLGGRSSTNDYGRAGFSSNLPTNAVEILPNMNKTSIMKGGERLPQFVNESPQAVEVLISSQNRISGTRYNFTADIGATIFRPRLVNVDSVVLPKLYNITSRNNHITLVAGLVSATGVPDNTGTPAPTLEFDLEPGYYTETSFCDYFNQRFKDEYDRQIWPGGGINRWLNWNFTNTQALKYANSVYGNRPNLTCMFQSEKNTFKIVHSNPGAVSGIAASETIGGATTNVDAYFSFWFDESCSFIQRGTNFIPFDYPSPSPDPFTTNYIFPRNHSAITIPSGTSGLIYTRFCTLSSNALHRYAFAESRVSRPGDGGGRGKIITVIDTSYYQIVDGFGGSFLPAEYPNSAVINVNNSQGQLEQYLDFIVRDEYGDSLDQIMTNPYDRFGVTFWLHVYF